MKYVIIGNSAAAIGCIEGIRQIDKDGSITVVTRENYPCYSRPLISYYLKGRVKEDNMHYRPISFYEEMKVKLITGKNVERINSTEKSIALEDGEVIAYDALLVSTGSRPFIPPTPGFDRVKDKFTFMTLDDAKALETTLTPKSRVLIIGAGLIGLKAAEGLAERVSSITVVDMAKSILPSILDEKASSLVKAHVETKGIELILSDSVKEYRENQAYLNSGKVLPFDILITAVGVRPNTELISQCQGAVNKGIVVDTCGKTSLEGIYSAGDCTLSHDISSDADKILALLPNAYMQGEAAGITMAGGSLSFDNAIPMNAISLFGLHIITAGCYQGESYVKEDSLNYKRLVTKDNLLKGYILVGDVKRAGIYTAMIRRRLPLTSIDFDLIKEKPQLMAFSKVDRKLFLGGVPH